MSPWHIYRIQLTSLLSITSRITGSAAALGIYAAGLSYAVMSSMHGFAQANAAFTEAVNWLAVTAATTACPGGYGPVYLGKLLLVSPVIYHSLNGIRHFIWDTGACLSIRGVYVTGYAVVGLTALISFYLVYNSGH